MGLYAKANHSALPLGTLLGFLYDALVQLWAMSFKFCFHIFYVTFFADFSKWEVLRNYFCMVHCFSWPVSAFFLINVASISILKQASYVG